MELWTLENGVPSGEFGTFPTYSSLVRTHSPTFPSLHLRHNSFSNPSVALLTSQLILRTFHSHSYICPSLVPIMSKIIPVPNITTHVRMFHSHSYIRPSLVPITSKIIPVPNITTHLRSFHSNSYICPSLVPIMSKIIPVPNITTHVRTFHSPTFPSLHLRHSSFSNLSVASPTSQLILQPFFHFSYVTGSSLTSPGEPPMYCMFLYGGYSI